MRILSLEISNILSIESASITFEDKGLVLVEGWNHDTQRSNAAGKTAIFNCLSFALFDKIPRKITASEILRREAKSGSATVNLLCGEDVWTVRRSRPKGVEFYKNGSRLDITQHEFESNIRFSYDQFILTVYTPQANSIQSLRFLTSSDSDKKSFILRLLNLDRFADLKRLTDGRIKELTRTIELANTQLMSNQSKIEAYEDSLIDVKEVSQSLSDLERSLIPITKEIADLSNVSKPDLSKYQKVEDDIRNRQTEISKAEVQRSFFHAAYREVTASIGEYDSSQKCSECGSSLDSKDARNAHLEHQNKAKQKALDLKKEIDGCDSIIAKKQSISELAKKLRDKKNLELSDYQAATDRISELKSLLRTKNIQVENLRLKLNFDSELRNKINELKQASAKIVATTVNEKNSLELYKTLSLVYSPTGAQAYVLDSVVDSFNEIVQKYIDILWPNASYILNSYKETSKGDTVAKFSETLTLDGKEVSVGSLSGGELKGLSLCVDFALLDVLSTQFGLSLNPIILDEPFDGLDAVGREIVIGLLEQLAKNHQILVVDHTSEAKALFTKTIFVSKRNGISSINVST